MIDPNIYQHEIAWRHEKVNIDYRNAQHMFSFKGIRRALGGSMIHVGTAIHGKQHLPDVETETPTFTVIEPQKKQPIPAGVHHLRSRSHLPAA